ncbi:MAG: hypothetical protein K8R91_02985 [Phycisphaerae bacterium]|nr:hypothetical protein [Phycisphaerae bacterium]
MSEWEARSPHDYMPSRVPRWLLRLLDHLMPSVSLAKSDRWRSFIVISIVLIGEQLIMLAFMLVSFVLKLNLVAPIEFLLIAISILVICALLLLNKYGHGELAIRLMMGATVIMAAIQAIIGGHPHNNIALSAGFMLIIVGGFFILPGHEAWWTSAVLTLAYLFINMWIHHTAGNSFRFEAIYFDLIFPGIIWLLVTVIAIVIVQYLRAGPQRRAADLSVRVNERARALEQAHAESVRMNRAMLNMLEDLENSNLELQRQRDQLAHVNRELESFAYSISHDLRAPLRAIEGFSRILQEELSGQLTEEPRRYLQIVRDSASEMETYVQAILQFSRSGQHEIEKTDVYPVVLVDEVVTMLKLTYPKLNIQVQIDSLPPCKADPLLLKQVFMNLIDNAIKYARLQKPIQIQVGSSRDHRPHEIVYFIHDNGVGFNMQYAEKLFTVFQRLHTDEEFEGTGVGLAIVQRIIHRHEGRVWAESRPGDGATFFVALPAE